MMKIDKHNGLKVAEVVLKKLRKIGSTDELKKLYNKKKILFSMSLECFDNCREQGYCLSLGPWYKIAFTENRNSDNIVVYCYSKTQCLSNLPAEGHWNDKKYFSYNQHSEVAAYIYERIKQFCVNAQAIENEATQELVNG